jgi:membrane protease YdiL (CAAX protease family)
MTFLDSARLGQNAWWRYVLGIGFILFATLFIGGLPLVVAIVYIGLAGNPATSVDRTTGALTGVDPAISLAINLASFVVAFAAIALAVRLIHRRPFVSLITPGRRIRWRRIALGFGVWFVLAGLISLVEQWIFPGRYALTLDLPRLLPFALVAVVLLPIQTSAEELFFRGYLLQGVGLLTRNRLLLAALNGLMFALPHIANPEVTVDFWLVMGFYFAFGAVLTLFVLRDNGLELALGIHAGNNLFTALLANYKGSALETPAVFTASGFTPWYTLVSTLIALAATYFIAFYWIKE